MVERLQAVALRYFHDGKAEDEHDEGHQNDPEAEVAPEAAAVDLVFDAQHHHPPRPAAPSARSIRNEPNTAKRYQREKRKNRRSTAC